MDGGEELSRDEDVVRALTSDLFDDARISSRVFAGARTSLSRLAIFSLEDHWAVFRRPGGVENPPKRRLLAIGEINVGHLQKVGREFKDNSTALTVIADPLDWNEAHAIIPQKISKGLANELKRHLKIHHEP